MAKSSLAYVRVLMSQSLPSLAHAFDSRRTSTSNIPEPFGQKIAENILSLIPFLSDPKSAVRFSSVREAWQAVWDQVEAGEAGALIERQGVSHFPISGNPENVKLFDSASMVRGTAL